MEFDLYMKLSVKKYLFHVNFYKKDKVLTSLKSKYQKFKLKKLINNCLNLIFRSTNFPFKINKSYIEYFKPRYYYLNRKMNIYYEKLNKNYSFLKAINSFFDQSFYTRYGNTW